MKRLLILLPAFLLAGCLATPVKRNFPDVPKEMLTSCPELQEVEEGTTKLSEVLKVVTANYSEYHECRIKMDSWVEWYNAQKKIFDSVK
jgi:nitrate reductase gamma subunit